MTAFPDAGSITVADLIGATVVRVDGGATVADAARTLIQAEVGAVVVGADPRPAALLSERDITRVVAGGQDPAAVPAADIASTNLVWCEAGDTVDKVATRMTDRHIRHILVEDDGELVGIVSARDLLGVYASDADIVD